MDGNRRWSKQEYRDKPDRDIGYGHRYGYMALERVLKWCLALDVECVTVYAFSIENFKRTPEEVSFLMSFAVEKCQQLSSKTSWIKDHSVSIKMVGDQSLLDHDVREKIEASISKTAGGTKILNVACPYTSINEIERALWSKDQNASIDTYLDFNSCPPLDLLIRTSGEHRLSDFMLWQITTSNALVLFEKTLWPEFSFLSFAWLLMQFQYFRLTNKA